MSNVMSYSRFMDQFFRFVFVAFTCLIESTAAPTIFFCLADITLLRVIINWYEKC